MNESQLIASQPQNQQAINDLIVDSIRDIKGSNISVLDLRDLDERPTDFFIICQGESDTKVKAISNNIQKRLYEEADSLPDHIEGMEKGRWVLLDYFNVVIHVFLPEVREYYNLDGLWSDAQTTTFQSL